MIDKVDLQLIRYLQDSPRASYAELSRIVGVSQATVKRRVESLISEEVITPAMVPYIQKVGYPATALVGLNVRMDQLERILELAADFPEVSFVATAMGRYDILVVVVGESIQDLADLITKRLTMLEGVTRSETIIMPRLVKLIVDWRLPTEDPANDASLKKYSEESRNRST